MLVPVAASSCKFFLMCDSRASFGGIPRDDLFCK